MDQIGGRKFIFAITVLAVGIVLVYTGKIAGHEWLTFCEVIGGVYVAGNVAEKVTDTVGGNNNG